MHRASAIDHVVDGEQRSAADLMPVVVRSVDAVPLPDEPEPEPVLAIPAADFARAEGAERFTWTRIGNLGQWGAAPLALPQGLPRP